MKNGCHTVEGRGTGRSLIRFLRIPGTQARLCSINNRLPLDYLLIRFLPPGSQRYRFSEERPQTSKASTHKTLAETVNILLQECKSMHDTSKQ